MRSICTICCLVFTSASASSSQLHEEPGDAFCTHTEEDDSIIDMASLLQLSFSSDSSRLTGAAVSSDGHYSCSDMQIRLKPSPMVRSLTNIQWLHIPKAGMSFVATLWNYACGQTGPPLDLAFDSSTCHDFFNLNLADRFRKDVYCVPGVLSKHFAIEHEPLIRERHEEVVGFFRRPNQRLISAFQPPVVNAEGFSMHELHRLNSTCQERVGCFARYPGVAGCATRMLTGHTCGEIVPEAAREGWDGGMSLVDDALKALSGMSFVGLTERWDESVCLFHRMFGGRMSKAEFVDYHQGPTHQTTYDETELHGFRDEADEIIYKAAVERFEALLREHVPANESPCGDRESVEAGTSDQECSCEAMGRECGATEAVDCGECPIWRLALAKLSGTLTCNRQQGKCMLDGQPVSGLYWKV